MGTKNPSDINQVLFCYNLNNLLKKKKKKSNRVSNFAFRTGSGRYRIRICFYMWLHFSHEFSLLGNFSANTSREALVQTNKQAGLCLCTCSPGSPVNPHSPKPFAITAGLAAKPIHLFSPGMFPTEKLKHHFCLASLRDGWRSQEPETAYTSERRAQHPSAPPTRRQPHTHPP